MFLGSIVIGTVFHNDDALLVSTNNCEQQPITKCVSHITYIINDCHYDNQQKISIPSYIPLVNINNDYVKCL